MTQRQPTPCPSLPKSRVRASARFFMARPRGRAAMLMTLGLLVAFFAASGLALPAFASPAPEGDTSRQADTVAPVWTDEFAGHAGRPIALEDAEPDQASAIVTIHDYYFDPQVVTITVGSIVQWTNAGPSTHSTTSRDGYWDWTLVPGSSFSVRFLSPGVFDYYCKLHPGHGASGRVVVTRQPVPPTPTSGPQPTPGPTLPVPTAEPGGDEIVFDYFNNEVLRDKTDLFVVRPDGSGRTQLTHTPERFEAQPSWSPDRNEIAYTTSIGDRQSDVWQIAVLDRRSGARRAVTSGPEDYEPDWKPDGSAIVFTKLTRYGGRLVRSEIATVSPTGGLVRPLIRLDSTVYALLNPCWSPDGRQVAFTVGSDFAGGDLYVMDADGRNARRVFEHRGFDDIDPAWSPDGRFLAFASGWWGGNLQSTYHGIWVLDLVSGVAGAVAQTPTWDLRRPAWSPDGTEIVFNAQFQSNPARWALYTVPALGGPVQGPLSTGVEPDWASGSLMPPLPTPGPLPTVTPTEVTPPTPPPFPTLPTPVPTAPVPSPTVPGPTPTYPPLPTFPPLPTTEATPTWEPTEAATATATQEQPEPTSTATPVTPAGATIFLPIAHQPKTPAM